VAQFPTLTFKSSHVRRTGKGYIADGDLTIKGLTRAVSVPFKAFGPIKDPWGGTRIGIVSSPITIGRSDFGMTYDLGPISDEVTIRLSAEATLSSPLSAKPG
jgi:polyisoprenoid-binding protein YceI